MVFVQLVPLVRWAGRGSLKNIDMPFRFDINVREVVRNRARWTGRVGNIEAPCRDMTDGVRFFSFGASDVGGVGSIPCLAGGLIFRLASFGLTTTGLDTYLILIILLVESHLLTTRSHERFVRNAREWVEADFECTDILLILCELVTSGRGVRFNELRTGFPSAIFFKRFQSSSLNGMPSFLNSR